MGRSFTVVGSAELVDLPEWGILGVRGKIDTGARTSALHVSNVREIGNGRVVFDVRLHRRKTDRIVHVEAAILRRGRVRSSTGHLQPRVFVTTTIRIGKIERSIELGLVDREHMIFRMLIGRTALVPGVLVDPGRRYVLTPGKKRIKEAWRAL